MSAQDEDSPAAPVPVWRPWLGFIGVLVCVAAAVMGLTDDHGQQALLGLGAILVLGGGFLLAHRRDVLTYRSRNGTEARRRLDRSLGDPGDPRKAARKVFWVSVVSIYFGDFGVARSELDRLGRMALTAADRARHQYGEGMLALFERRDYDEARRLLQRAHGEAEQAVKDSTDSEGPDFGEVEFARACVAARESAWILGHPADEASVDELDSTRARLLPGYRLPVLFALATWHHWEERKVRADSYVKLIRGIGPNLRAVLDLPRPPRAGGTTASDTA